MKITNKYNAPEAFHKAVQNDPYSPGTIERYREESGDTESTIKDIISATTLVGPQQLRRLYKKHYDELEEDVTDRTWAVMGSAIHLLLERAEDLEFDFDKAVEELSTHERREEAREARQLLRDLFGKSVKIVQENTRPGIIREGRYFSLINGYLISGQADRLLLELQKLVDYKVTSAWTVYGGRVRDEWIAQLNIYRWLLKRNGITIKEIEVGYFLRDWSRLRAISDRDYPQHNLGHVNIPLWSLKKTEEYILERLGVHFSKGSFNCTDEERWAKPEEYAVMKKGRKSALRVKGLDTYEKAFNWADNKGHTTDGKLNLSISIDLRPRDYIRCQHYCPVSTVCKQWKRDIKSGNVVIANQT